MLLASWVCYQLLKMGKNTINLGQQITDRLVVTTNLDTEIITTTKDKLQVCLMQNEQIIKRKNDWITPMTLILSTATTLLTSDFNRDFFWIDKDLWRSLFILVLAASVLWLIVSLVNAFRLRNRGSIKQLIQHISQGTDAC